jgi:hypothetical protein
MSLGTAPFLFGLALPDLEKVQLSSVIQFANIDSAVGLYRPFY